MDLTITNNRICAAMPGHQLCLDYQLPAVKKIFAQFLKQHPLILNYTDCHFNINPYGPISTIDCSSDPYRVTAEETKFKHFDPALGISLSKRGTRGFEDLHCDKNGCSASNYGGFDYRFHRNPGGECFESFRDC